MLFVVGIWILWPNRHMTLHWFLTLLMDFKSFWFYFCDNCVFYVNFKEAGCHIVRIWFWYLRNFSMNRSVHIVFRGVFESWPFLIMSWIHPPPPWIRLDTKKLNNLSRVGIELLLLRFLDRTYAKNLQLILKYSVTLPYFAITTLSLYPPLG